MEEGTHPIANAPRRRRRDLESLILEMGSRVLSERGLSEGAEHVTFKVVFDRLLEDQGVRVTNASVIGRIWKNQGEFQRAVLLRMAIEEAPDLSPVTEAVGDALRHADQTSLEGRRRALGEASRQAGAAAIEALSGSSASRGWLGLWSTQGLGRSPQGDGAVTEHLSAWGARAREETVALCAVALDRLGFVPSRGIELATIADAIATLAIGAALSHEADQDISPHRLPTGPAGSLQPWSVLGLGIAAILQQLCVPSDLTPR